MPSVSTHVAFARLILPKLETDSYSFLLGAIAPDTFDRADSKSFQQHHFAGNDGVLDLNQIRLMVAQTRQHCGLYEISFVDGYYSHLWLDDYVRAHADTVTVMNPDGLDEGDLRKAVRACMEEYNLTIIGDFLTHMNIPSQSMETISGFKFVSIGRAKEMFQQLRETSQNRGKNLEAGKVMDEQQYHRFLSLAAEDFVASR